MAVLTAVLGVLLALTTTGVAYAADGGIKIEVDADKVETTHQLNAYQVFSGTLSGSGTSDDPYKLADIVWGDDVDSDATTDGTSLLKTLQGDSAFNVTKDGSTVNLFKDCTTAAQVADVMDDEAFTADMAKAFAKDVKANKTGNGTALTYYPKSGDQSAYYGVTGIEDGYWAVIDETPTSTLKNDQMQDVVLQVAGTVTVTEAKINTVQSGKDTKDGVTDPTTITVNDTAWGDTDDYNIGDDVPFRIWGAVPADVAEYTDGYDWTLTDTLDDGFTLGTTAPDNLKVYTAPLNSDGTPNYAQAAEMTNYSDYLTVAIDQTNSHKFTVSAKANASSGDDADKGSMAFVDNPTTFAGKAIIVTYTAKLNSNAVPSTAEVNTVNLTHTTDKSSHGTTGTTPDDKTYTFTYELDNTKVDSTDSTKTIGNAKFKLVRLNPASTDESKSYDVASITDGKVSGWTAVSGFNTEGANTLNDGDEITSSGTDGTFNVQGLDEGTYYLVETVPPTGYNKLTAPVEFTIAATTGLDTQTNLGKIESLSLTTEDPAKAVDQTTDMTTAGKVAQSVGNTPAGTLPSTGGMGTVLYVTVGLLVMAAAATGITIRRRRANGQQ